MVTTVVIPRAGVVCAAIIRGVENIVRLLVDVDGGGIVVLAVYCCHCIKFSFM